MAVVRAPGGNLMADQSDVEQVLAAIASGLLYPEGPSGESAVGVPCRIFRGWPDAPTLDADLLAGRVTVTVAGDARGQRTTTRYPDVWRSLRPVAVTLSIAVVDDTATFSGQATLGQIAGLLAGQVAAVHRTVPGDTPVSVAAALGGALASVPGPLSTTTVEGTMVIVPAAPTLIARVVADQPSIRETRRQLQAFRIVCWCPDPATRDLVAGTIDSAMATYDFLGLPDGMAGRVRFLSSTASDRAQDAALYRRDLIYTVDYATTLSADLPRLLVEDTRGFGDGVLIKTLLS
jgi:hypothetical protein